MFKKIRKFIRQKMEIKKHKTDLKKMKKYYEILKAGGIFLTFVHQDFDRMKKDMNRAERRRWDTALNHEGKFTEDIIKHYLNNIDNTLAQMEAMTKKKSVKPKKEK